MRKERKRTKPPASVPDQKYSGQPDLGCNFSRPQCLIIIIIIIINLIYIAQFNTNGILTALYIVITYIQMQYVHV